MEVEVEVEVEVEAEVEVEVKVEEETCDRQFLALGPSKFSSSPVGDKKR